VVKLVRGFSTPSFAATSVNVPSPLLWKRKFSPNMFET
jgi:hypothetical protein